MNLAEIIIFSGASAGLIAFSWRSLLAPGSHGFHRFFAFEAIAALILVNSHAWFSDPFSAQQILSWILLVASLILLLTGAQTLRTAGKPTGERADKTLFRFEKTSALVTTGIYRYIRHPLYGSLLFLAWGSYFKEVTWISAGLVILATWFLVQTAKADEFECLRTFGEAYTEYMRRTKRFLPFLY